MNPNKNSDEQLVILIPTPAERLAHDLFVVLNTMLGNPIRFTKQYLANNTFRQIIKEAALIILMMLIFMGTILFEN